MALKRPVETSHARGLAGTPVPRPAFERRREGVVQCLLGEVESPSNLIRVARTRRESER